LRDCSPGTTYHTFIEVHDASLKRGSLRALSFSLRR
jgi:hypothetical protein